MQKIVRHSLSQVNDQLIKPSCYILSILNWSFLLISFNSAFLLVPILTK